MSDQASAALLIVRDRMEQGQTLGEAAADFLTDDYFEAWYQNTLSTLSTLVDHETLTGEMTIEKRKKKNNFSDDPVRHASRTRH